MSDEHLQKLRNISRQKYGCDYFVASDKVRSKIDQSIKEKLKSNPNFRKDAAKKAMQTHLERYGTTSPLNLEKNREKMKEVMKAKYGVEYGL